MGRRNRRKRYLPVVMAAALAFTLGGCGETPEQKEEKEAAEARQELENAWDDAYMEARDAYGDLEYTIASAAAESGSGTEMEELTQTIEEARQVLNANEPDSEKPEGDAEAYQAAEAEFAEKKEALTAANEALKGALDRYHKAREEKTAFKPTVTESVTGKSVTGVQIEATVSLSPWMKGDDIGRLNGVWRAAGGEEDLPISEDDINSPMENAVVLIGQISYKNLTPDFDPESFEVVLADFYDETMDDTDLKARAGAFGAEGSNVSDWNQSNACKAYVTRTSEGVRKPDGGYGCVRLPKPAMEGRENWGPTPFAIVYGNYLTAETPEGDPRLDYIRFSLDFGGYTMTITKEANIIGPTKEW